jgi:hypothetical protein
MLADTLLEGFAPGTIPSTKAKRFLDGAAFRIEIPSIEAPKVLETVLDEENKHREVVNRASQSSGAMSSRTEGAALNGSIRGVRQFQCASEQSDATGCSF